MNFDIFLPKVTVLKKKDTPKDYPLEHQIRTAEELLKNDIVINCSQTGSGKTKAVHQYLLNLEKESKKQILKNRDGESIIYEPYNVIIVSPINMILSQMFQDTHNFVKNNNLHFNIIPINRNILNAIQEKMRSSLCRGEILNSLLESLIANKSIVESSISKIYAVNICIAQQPTIFIINPDIFYGAIMDIFYKRFTDKIQFNIIEFTKYIVFDEFHYYDISQLHTFFVLMAMWKIGKYFDLNKVKCCLLSATPNQWLMETIQNKLKLRCKCINEEFIRSDPSFNQSDYEEIDFLSPSILHVHKIEEINTFQAMMQDSEISDIIVDYIKKGCYGLIICNSINAAEKIYRFYTDLIGTENCGKITGRESHDDRQMSVKNKLIIATSTVDIGFNFDRQQKPPTRQNIDFVFADYQSFDDFIQRIGRGGRVLNKDITTKITNLHVFMYAKKYKQLINEFDKIPPSLTRNEILGILKKYFDEREHYIGFFRKFGFISVKAFLACIKEASLIKFPSSDGIKIVLSDIIQNLEFILGDIYEVETEEQWEMYRQLNLLRDAVESIQNNSFNKLSHYNQKALLYNFLRNNEFKYINPMNHLNGYQKLLEFCKIVPPTSKDEDELRKEISIINDMLKNFATETCNDDTKFQKFISLLNKGKHLDAYVAYRKCFFDNLLGTFRGSTFAFPITVINDDKSIGSNEFQDDFFRITKRYNFNIVNEEKGIIKMIEEWSKPIDFEFKIKISNAITEDQFCGNDKNDVFRTRQYLWKFVFFNKGELKLPETSMFRYPNVIKKMINNPIIAYITPYGTNGWDFLKSYGLESLQSFPLKVEGDRLFSKNYRIFFGKDAFIAMSQFHYKRTKKEDP